MLETVIAIVASLLSASGVFAATGVLELLKKFFSLQRAQHAVKPPVSASIKLPPATILKQSRDDWDVQAAPAPVVPSAENPPLHPSDAQRIETPWDSVQASASPGPGRGLVYAFILVVFVFAIAIGVVWTLTHIGGPLEATVNATVAKAGGSILIVGGGLFAAFFAVSFMAFIAIRFFAGRFDR
jgi:hypothetical protein